MASAAKLTVICSKDVQWGLEKPFFKSVNQARLPVFHFSSRSVVFTTPKASSKAVHFLREAKEMQSSIKAVVFNKLATQLSLIDNLCTAKLDQIPLFKLFLDEKKTFLELTRFWCGGTACPVLPIHHPLFKTETKTQNVVIRLVNSVNKESATIQVMISSYISTILELCRRVFLTHDGS